MSHSNNMSKIIHIILLWICVYQMTFTKSSESPARSSVDSKDTTLPFGTLLRTFGHSSGQIWEVELLSNGFVAAGDSVGNISIWNPNNGEFIRTMSGHNRTIIALKLLQNGNLASGSYDKKLIIWDVNTGNIVISVQNEFSTTALETLLDGRIVAGATNGDIRIYDPNTLSLIFTIPAYSLEVEALQLLPNGNFASASQTRIKIWSPKRDFIQVSAGAHPWEIYDLELIHNGNLASAGRFQLLAVWNSVTGILIEFDYLYSKTINRIKYLNNNLLAVSGYSSSKHIEIYNTLTWDKQITLSINTTDWVTCLELLSDGNLIAGSIDGLLRVWKI